MKDIISMHKIICKNKKVKKCHKRYIGKLALMCPHCYEICMLDMDRKLKYNVKDDCKITTFTKFFGKCKHCHEFADYIEIDGNIAKTIKILNRKGYFTKFCCEGHDKVKRKRWQKINSLLCTFFIVPILTVFVNLFLFSNHLKLFLLLVSSLFYLLL